MEIWFSGSLDLDSLNNFIKNMCPRSECIRMMIHFRDYFHHYQTFVFCYPLQTPPLYVIIKMHTEAMVYFYYNYAKKNYERNKTQFIKRFGSYLEVVV